MYIYMYILYICRCIIKKENRIYRDKTTSTFSTLTLR